MKVVLTLSEALHNVNSWERFCEITGFSEWSVNEGGGDIETTLKEEHAVELGILRIARRADQSMESTRD